MGSRRSFVTRVALGLAFGVVAVMLAGYAWLQWAPRRVPAGQPPLVTLERGSLQAVKDAFNAGEGEVRLLAMLSPT